MKLEKCRTAEKGAYTLLSLKKKGTRKFKAPDNPAKARLVQALTCARLRPNGGP